MSLDMIWACAQKAKNSHKTYQKGQKFKEPEEGADPRNLK